MIDCHTHIVRWMSQKEEPFTEDKLLKRADELGIDKFVLLPIGVSPESSTFLFSSEDALASHSRHPDRIIPFCNLDPRQGNNSPDTDFSWVLDEYKQKGCKGLGELTANLYMDDPKNLNLLRQCGEAGMPVLFHLFNKLGVSYGLVDDIRLPRLEKALKELPKTVFIGHAMAFWSEISADVNEETRGAYPSGAIIKEGKIQELFRKYPNLYADLSAGSGFNAITRDPAYGYKFIEEFCNRLLFGTDLCHVAQDVPIVDYFRSGLKESRISRQAFDKITRLNAEKLFNA